MHDFSPPCWARAAAISVPGCRRPSGELVVDGTLLGQHDYAPSNDYNRRRPRRASSAALQDGHFHHPVLPGRFFFLKRFGSESNEVVDRGSTSAVSRVGGITIRDIQNDTEARHEIRPSGLLDNISMELANLGEHKLHGGKLTKIICTTR